MTARTTPETFWSKVDTSGPCWMWNGTRTTGGYGQVKVGGRRWHAHRYAWTLVRGPIPEGMDVLHRCDNRSCVNAERCLFLGGDAENAADRAAKGRSATGARNGAHTHPERRPWGLRNGRHTKPQSRCPGERNGNARLTREDVEAIRRAYRPYKVGLRAFARRYGVAVSTVHCIVTGRGWANA